VEQFLNQELPPFINAVFQYLVAAILTPLNIGVFLFVFLFLSIVFVSLQTWWMGVDEHLKLLKKIEENTRPKP
jgi:hypothetical protein